MLVQIYEVQTPDEAAVLARLGVDHIGVLIGEGVFSRELPPARELPSLTDDAPREGGEGGRPNPGADRTP